MSVVFSRVVGLLDFLAKSPVPLGVVAIAKTLNEPKGSISRLLSMLLEHNFVIRNSEGLYQMGPAPLLWASAYKHQKGLEGLCRPYLQRILGEVNETVQAYAYEDKKPFVLLRLESDRSVSTRFVIGQQPSLHCTGGGKAILMHLPPEELDEFLAQPLTAQTARSITNPLALREQLERFRARGFTEENAEHEDDIRCVGVALLDAKNYPVGALSVVAASYRFSDEDALRAGKLLREAADEINAKLRGEASPG